MANFNFWLSYEDTERLFAIKKIEGKESLTGNEYAELILSRELRKMFPAVPETDESGKIINAECYKGRSN